jgi:integrase
VRQHGPAPLSASAASTADGLSAILARSGSPPASLQRPIMSVPRHRHDGLKKRCACSRKDWSRCPHPWHFGFHWQGREHRYSLHAIAKRERRYVMSKTEAQGLADKLRTDIRDGKHDSASSLPEPGQTALTLSDIAREYLKRHVNVPSRRKTAAKSIENYVRILERLEISLGGDTTAQLGSRAFATITKADLEAAREARRHELARVAGKGRVRPGCKAGEVGIEHLMAIARQIWNWAIVEGYVEVTPFKRGGVSVIRVKNGASSPRTRRLNDDEETRLMAAASPHLQALIIAALETGCRLGELLSLQWHQVRWDDNVLLLPASKTKTAVARDVPMTTRLKAGLEMRRHGPDGKEHPSDKYVFGNEVGERVGRVMTAWRAACRRATITDLHFHDLRREFASRLLESGASEHEVRDWLGHANITTTSRYLSTTRVRLQRARVVFEAHQRRPVAKRQPAKGAHGQELQGGLAGSVEQMATEIVS